MANDKISLPSSGSGIIRYFDEFKSKFALKPEHVIILIVIVMILEIILHIYGKALL